jgi:hypothetical protein
MPIHCRGQAREIFPPVNVPSLQLACEVRSTASQRDSRRLDSRRHGEFFIEIPCILTLFDSLSPHVTETRATRQKRREHVRHQYG